MRPPVAQFWISDFGFWILDFGFRILDFGFRISDFGFRILDFGALCSNFFWCRFRILDFWFWYTFWTLHKIRILVTPTRVGGFRTVFKEFLFEECKHFWKENASPIQWSWCTQVKLEPGHGARLAMFSARFNKKNKETCIAVVTRIQAPKFFCTHHISCHAEQEPSRIFP